MDKNNLKSEKGLTLVKLVLIVIVLMILAGMSTYVALINMPGSNVNQGNQVENSVNQVEENNM